MTKREVIKEMRDVKKVFKEITKVMHKLPIIFSQSSL